MSSKIQSGDKPPHSKVANAQAADGADTVQQPAVRQQAGRYRVERVLGQGGYGTVYLAHDEQLHRHVALKVPHRRHVRSAEDVQVYLAEARVLASLDHPHVVPVFDVGKTEDGCCYIVSKYVDGSSLALRLHESRLTALQAAELAAAIAEALRHAHQRNIVHRDVKPGNILLDVAGQAYLADFGLAIKEEDYGKLLRRAGTPAYMSPEQARGEGHLLDRRSDVFTLGIVFYECLTGTRPFRGESADDLIDRILHLEACPPRHASRPDDPQSSDRLWHRRRRLDQPRGSPPRGAVPPHSLRSGRLRRVGQVTASDPALRLTACPTGRALGRVPADATG